MKKYRVRKGNWNIDIEKIFEAEAIALLEIVIDKNEALDKDNIIELADALEFRTFVRLVQENDKWWRKYIELVEDWFEEVSVEDI